MRIGYQLSSEEFGPADLDQACRAEQAGFEALWISDHYHPWNEQQGQSPFVWSTIGALSQVCRLPVTTAVTCPLMRMQPAIVAQAAATSAVLHEGRFVLGVGAGEALNEHIHGEARIAHRTWPNEALPGELAQVLPSPTHFEQATTLVPEQAVRDLIPTGPDPAPHLAAIEKYRRAGYDEVYVANIGPHWPDFFDLYAKEVLPAARG